MLYISEVCLLDGVEGQCAAFFCWSHVFLVISHNVSIGAMWQIPRLRCFQTLGVKGQCFSIADTATLRTP
jgi:hypothetical protein